MRELSEDDRARLAELNTGYGRSLPGKRRELRRLWRAVKLESAIDNPIDALRRIVHNLAGSAPMYGYDQLAERAATLDDCLRAAIEDGAKDATWHTGCEQAYLALYHELHVAMERDTP